ATTSTHGALLQSASRWPDDDERNRHRYLRDLKHDIVHDGWGRPLPYDPLTLTMGSLTGTSSQGHAHYALADPPLSDDPRVLMKDPAHFAVPSWTRAWGGEFAQLYADLALLARVNNAPAAPWLEATFAGASFHHIQDTANQIHTLQVGPFGFFRAAILQLVKRDLLTQGGLLGERTTLNALGLRIISNHHLLLEDLFAKRVKESIEGHPQVPEVSAALAGLGTDDAAFAAEAKAKIDSMPPGRFAHGLVKALVAEGGVEGPEAYRLIWRLSVPTLHDGRGYEYDGAKGDDPDKFVDVTGPDAQATLAAFYALESKGLHRATTAQRIWLDDFEAEARLPDARARASSRILSVLLPYHLERMQRSQAYVADPPAAQQKIAWGYPAVTLALILWIVWRLRRKPGRRSSSGLLEKLP
ncbi:MAG: hypothetical protein JST92_27645, partial [Deltaproteobacteria bacterium]|nr:hypothetical protein [Deltaproteobacteria bacterium]